MGRGNQREVAETKDTQGPHSQERVWKPPDIGCISVNVLCLHCVKKNASELLKLSLSWPHSESLHPLILDGTQVFIHS